MLLTGEFTLLETEQRPSIKDPTKPCNLVLLMQKTETIRCACDDACYTALKQYDLYAPVNVELFYSLRYKSLRISNLLQ